MAKAVWSRRDRLEHPVERQVPKTVDAEVRRRSPRRSLFAAISSSRDGVSIP